MRKKINLLDHIKLIRQIRAEREAYFKTLKTGKPPTVVNSTTV